jgi:hypothetical protein
VERASSQTRYLAGTFIQGRSSLSCISMWLPSPLLRMSLRQYFAFSCTPHTAHTFFISSHVHFQVINLTPPSAVTIPYPWIPAPTFSTFFYITIWSHAIREFYWGHTECLLGKPRPVQSPVTSSRHGTPWRAQSPVTSSRHHLSLSPLLYAIFVLGHRHFVSTSYIFATLLQFNKYISSVGTLGIGRRIMLQARR